MQNNMVLHSTKMVDGILFGLKLLLVLQCLLFLKLVNYLRKKVLVVLMQMVLNLLEKEMGDIITEQKKTIEDLRIDLETEKESRELEAAAYRNEIERLTDLVKELRGTVSAQGDEIEAKDKLIKKVYGDLDRARIERDEAQNLLRLQQENDETEWATPLTFQTRSLSNQPSSANRAQRQYSEIF